MLSIFVNSRPTIFFLTISEIAPPRPTQNPAHANATAPPVLFSLKNGLVTLWSAVSQWLARPTEVRDDQGSYLTAVGFCLSRKQSRARAADLKLQCRLVVVHGGLMVSAHDCGVKVR